MLNEFEHAYTYSDCYGTFITLTKDAENMNAESLYDELEHVNTFFENEPIDLSKYHNKIMEDDVSDEMLEEMKNIYVLSFCDIVFSEQDGAFGLLASKSRGLL